MMKMMFAHLGDVDALQKVKIVAFSFCAEALKPSLIFKRFVLIRRL